MPTAAVQIFAALDEFGRLTARQRSRALNESALLALCQHVARRHGVSAGDLLVLWRRKRAACAEARAALASIPEDPPTQ